MPSPTHAVVSLLDPVHAAHVEAIWRRLRERFGLRGVEQTPWPHVSYVVAVTACSPAIRSGLASLAAGREAFTIRATGLGVFPGEEPVIYLPVVRASAIDAMHASIESLHDDASAVVERYRGDRWLPHITLARGDVDDDILAAAVDDLARTPIDWSIAIDNLTLIDDDGADGASPRPQRFELNARR